MVSLIFLSSSPPILGQIWKYQVDHENENRLCQLYSSPDCHDWGSGEHTSEQIAYPGWRDLSAHGWGDRPSSYICYPSTDGDVVDDDNEA